MKNELFHRAGGFPEQPILEELELLRRLEQYGRIAMAGAGAPVYVSPRRWQQYGLVRTTLINQLMLAGFLCGIAPARLARLYYRTQSGAG